MLVFGQAGPFSEKKQLLTDTPELQRLQGGKSQVAYTPRQLPDVNWNLNLHEEGNDLTWPLFDEKQIDSRRERFIPRDRSTLWREAKICLPVDSIVFLTIYIFPRRKKERTIHHFERAFGITSSFD